MKKIIFCSILFTIVVIAACNNHIDTKMCKAHSKNCPTSENCPEHPECEAHEKCEKEKDCKEHPACVAFEKQKTS